MSQRRSQRESTTMTETLRKRGYDESDIRKAIDLTEADDETMTNGTGYPNSSQTSSSRQMAAQPHNSGHSYVSFHPNTQQCILTPQFARVTSEDEESPFKRMRRR
ncbi:hypothetical protein ColLi_04073 [Colletotrichum liriopes]|uniref:Uncharacterized protein n=1 Tax=Colletotrichum liriopes TaxID=708192 RepID=A0AA37LQ84_9PEZI|nr:hypothetical protein ColLi_04073 [Colletotrichum liriopes]